MPQTGLSSEICYGMKHQAYEIRTWCNLLMVMKSLQINPKSIRETFVRLFDIKTVKS